MYMWWTSTVSSDHPPPLALVRVHGVYPSDREARTAVQTLPEAGEGGTKNNLALRPPVQEQSETVRAYIIDDVER